MHDAIVSPEPEAYEAASEPRGTDREAGGRRRERYLPTFALVPGRVLAKPLVFTERGVLSFSLPAGKALLHKLRAHRAEFN